MNDPMPMNEARKMLEQRVWVTQDFRCIPVTSLTDLHLTNILFFLDDRLKHFLTEDLRALLNDWVMIMKEEQTNRIVNNKYEIQSQN